jgi:hypothetical protein
MKLFGSLAFVVTTVSWLGIFVLLRRSARLQINTDRRFAEFQKDFESLINYVEVLKGEHHAAQMVLASWSPAHQTPGDTTLGAALKDLAMAVAEVDAEEIRRLPEPPPSAAFG